MMILLYVLAGIVALILILLIVLPSNVHVERSITINAPAEKAFEQVNELKNWNNWSPWNKIDPDMTIEYSAPSKGQGASYTWRSDHKSVGNGTLTLSEVEENKKIVNALSFEKWGDNSSTMFFDGENGSVKVKWVMDNEFKGFMKFFAPMMKKTLTKQFDEGLANIKAIAEK